MKYKLVLENGKEFFGLNFGANGPIIGEIFFNTSMVGYQDLLSDPSYFGKIACMTYPLIGNYGLTDEDYDFKNIFIKGYVVKENNDSPSNFRSTRTLSDAMEENKVVGISDIDTRELTKIIRDEGTMKALIIEENVDHDECMKMLNEYQEESCPVSQVSCKKIWYSRTANPSHTVVVIDLGVKTSVVKKLNELGLNIVVVPYDITLDQIKKLKPQGIILSNGPGNPSLNHGVLSLLDLLIGKYPLLGLGLGAQIIALKYGCEVAKMKYGHQGANLPVKNVMTNKIEITSQNHFYAIKSLNEKLTLTHINVIDNDIEGFVDEQAKVIAVQYLADDEIINKFIKSMKK